MISEVETASMPMESGKSRRKVSALGTTKGEIEVF